MQKLIINVTMAFVGISFIVGVNYLLALAGEPRSLWLMNLLGLI